MVFDGYAGFAINFVCKFGVLSFFFFFVENLLIGLCVYVRSFQRDTRVDRACCL